MSMIRFPEVGDIVCAPVSWDNAHFLILSKKSNCYGVSLCECLVVKAGGPILPNEVYSMSDNYLVQNFSLLAEIPDSC
jgi:hypothetical protein